MRRLLLALATGLLLGAAAGAPATAAEGCFGHHALCVGVCTPDRVARYYAGSERRCTASCGPRYQQCLRTGWWADLEVLRSGGWEKADGL